MRKITIEREVLNYIAEKEIIKKHEKKAKTNIKKNRINELTSQGIDEEIAKVMASIEFNPIYQ